VPKPKFKFKVTMNWQGEKHEIYTSANTTLAAQSHAFSRLAKRLGRSVRFLTNYFDGSKDNIKVEKV